MSHRNSVYHEGEDTLLKELVLQLNQGDVLRTVAQPTTQLFSDNGVQTSFTGFLIYPSA